MENETIRGTIKPKCAIYLPKMEFKKFDGDILKCNSFRTNLNLP